MDISTNAALVNGVRSLSLLLLVTQLHPLLTKKGNDSNRSQRHERFQKYEIITVKEQIMNKKNITLCVPNKETVEYVQHYRNI